MLNKFNINKKQFSRRNFLKSLGYIAAGSSLPLYSSNSKKPNFVFILIDDMGWPDIGCYGNKFHETPNTDRLASQGMRFTDAYAACPVCSPTRASIISGQYPARVGITDFIPGHWRPYEKLRVPKNKQQYLPLEITTFAEALKPAGYTSGTFGKWHLGSKKHYPDKQGFDTMLVHSGRHFKFRTFPPVKIKKDEYLSEFLTRQSEEFLETNKDKPFLLYLSHYAVHIPLEARDELIEKYKNKPAPPEGVNNPVYAAMVEHVDRSVGRILKKLDELNLSKNTVVFFFSDNGGLRQNYKKKGPIVSSNAPLRDEKGTLYEGGIREPLIVRWPGKVKSGSTCDTPVTSVDFYPTFLDIAGINNRTDQILDGQSILPLLKNSSSFKRDAIYWHYPHYHHSTPAGAIRQGNYKLIEFYEDGRLELYNLKKDIGEKNNLAEKMPEKTRKLKQKLEIWRKSVKCQMPIENPNYDPARAGEWGRHPDRKKITNKRKKK